MLLNSAERTTERMAAFMPGASPPDVSIAILETLEDIKQIYKI